MWMLGKETSQQQWTKKSQQIWKQIGRESQTRQINIFYSGELINSSWGKVSTASMQVKYVTPGYLNIMTQVHSKAKLDCKVT